MLLLLRVLLNPAASGGVGLGTSTSKREEGNRYQGSEREPHSV